MKPRVRSSLLNFFDLPGLACSSDPTDVDTSHHREWFQMLFALDLVYLVVILTTH